MSSLRSHMIVSFYVVTERTIVDSQDGVSQIKCPVLCVHEDGVTQVKCVKLSFYFDPALIKCPT